MLQLRRDTPGMVRLNISSCERKQYLIKQRNNMVRTIYERNENPNQRLRRMAQFFVDITGDEDA